MKRSTRQNIVLGILLGVLAMAIPGCQGKEISVALQTYTAAGEKIMAAREAGRISDKTQTEIIAPARDATKALLDQLVEDYLAERPVNWRAALVKVYAAMEPLLRQVKLLEASP